VNRKALLDASIVIPTRDRPASLARCVDALERQAFSGSLEILVVDDASQDPERVVEAVGSSRAKHLANRGRGAAAARNRGASAAQGRAILFIDDDCEPSADWVARLVEALAGGADVVAGETRNARPEDHISEASQTIANYLHAWSLRTEDEASFAASNNLACTRDVITRVPFDEAFPIAGGEDRDWCSRVAEAGFTLLTDHTAVVIHRQTLDLRGFVRQQLNYGRGAYLFRTRQGSAWRFAPLSFYGGLIRVAFAGGFAVGTLVCLAQAATAAGYVRGAFARQRRAEGP
jgi:glycosyltransferase involved in cell wall biosynthesis